MERQNKQTIKTTGKNTGKSGRFGSFSHSVHFVLYAGFILVSATAFFIEDSHAHPRPSNSMTRIQEVFRTLMGSKPMMFAGGSGVSAFRGKKSSAEAHHSVIQEQIKSEEKKEADEEMVPAVLPKWHMFTAAGRPMDDGFFFQPNPIGGLWGAPVRDDFLLTNEGVF